VQKQAGGTFRFSIFEIEKFGDFCICFNEKRNGKEVEEVTVVGVRLIFTKEINFAGVGVRSD
jgi:hypothetical protein